jgi:O-antigen/teichoic acid export membrane protein
MTPKKIAAFSLGPVLGAALSFVALPATTWIFSTADVGRISMMQVAANFCTLLYSLGLDQAYVREYHETKDKPVLLKTASAPGAALLLLCIAALFIYKPTILSSALFSIDSSTIGILAAVFLSASYISRFLSLILRMQERGLAYSASQVLPKLVFLLIILSYVLFPVDHDFMALITAQVVSTLTIMVLFAWNTRKEWLPALSATIDKEKLSSMARFGMPLILGSIASWGLVAADRLFLRGLSTFEELGIYSVAASIAAGFSIFSGIFSTIWAPTVYKWSADGADLKKIESIIEYMLAAIFFIFVLAGSLSWLLEYLLPSKYFQVQYLITACMVSPLLYALSEVTASGIGIARKTSYSMAASLIAVLVNVLGNYLLIPHHGAAGAAISTAFAFWLFLICRTEFSCLVWQAIPRAKLYGISTAILALVICMSLFQHIQRSTWAVIWLSAGIIGAFFFKQVLATAYRLASSSLSNLIRSPA